MELTSHDKQNFTHKVDRIKNDEKTLCKGFTNTFDNPQGDSSKKDIVDFNIDKVIKELNDSLNCDNLKNQAIKSNTNTSVNENTDSIYRNSNTVYDHDFAQNPIDIISDELICVEPVSSDNVKNCKCNGETIIVNQLNHVCEENNTDNINFVFNSQVDDNFSNSAKSNGIGLSVDLNSCNIDNLNNLDDQIIPVRGEVSQRNNEDISQSIKTRDANTQSDTQTLFNHGTTKNNLNIENILNQFKKLMVKAQDLQASYCKSVNVTLPNNLTKPGFPDITDVDDGTVWKNGTTLITGDSILSGLRESKMFK